jgi:hypothetical protein
MFLRLTFMRLNASDAGPPDVGKILTHLYLLLLSWNIPVKAFAFRAASGLPHNLISFHPRFFRGF